MLMVMLVVLAANGDITRDVGAACSRAFRSARLPWMRCDRELCTYDTHDVIMAVVLWHVAVLYSVSVPTFGWRGKDTSAIMSRYYSYVEYFSLSPIESLQEYIGIVAVMQIQCLRLGNVKK